MLEEALEKLDAGERDPAKALGPIIPKAEGDLVVLNAFQTAVGEGDAEDVAAQVVVPLLAFLTFDDEAEQYLCAAILRPGNVPASRGGCCGA